MDQNGQQASARSLTFENMTIRRWRNVLLVKELSRKIGFYRYIIENTVQKFLIFMPLSFIPKHPKNSGRLIFKIYFTSIETIDQSLASSLFIQQISVCKVNCIGFSKEIEKLNRIINRINFEDFSLSYRPVQPFPRDTQRSFTK